MACALCFHSFMCFVLSLAAVISMAEYPLLIICYRNCHKSVTTVLLPSCVAAENRRERGGRGEWCEIFARCLLEPDSQAARDKAQVKQGRILKMSVSAY